MYIQFADLPVFHQDRAKTFYTEHFACRVIADQPMSQDGWRWVELKFGNAQTNLHFIQRKDEVPSAGPVMVLIVEDVAATVAALQSKRIEIITQPQPAPWLPERTMAEFRDSEGNCIVLSTQ